MLSTASCMQRIRAALGNAAAGVASDAAETAQTYASFCVGANLRLRRCVEYLKKGMKSEALHEAEAVPVLLDLCGELDFVGVENWREICRRNGWAVPEVIDASAVSALNEVYASGLEVEPLLRTYRRAVRAKATGDCVRILRQLIKADPANANWADDLKAFERRRHEELQAEVESAAKAKHAKRLADLVAELDGPWSVPPSGALRNQAASRLREAEEGMALEEGRRIVEEMSAGYAALDFAQTQKAVRDYQGLMDGGRFSPSPSMGVQFTEANEWVEEQRKTRAEDMQFQETLAALQVAVEKGRAEKIDGLLNALSRFGRALPESLENRARLLVENHQVMAARVRTRRMVVTATLVLIGIGAAVGYFAYQQYEKDVAEASTAIDDAFRKQNLARYDELLVGLQKAKPRVFRSVRVQALAAKRGDIVRAIEMRKSTFESAVARLEELAKRDFRAEPAEVESLVVQAREVAVSSDEASRLRVFIEGWEQSRRTVQAARDGQLKSVLVRVARGFSGLGSVEDSAVREKLWQLRALVDEAEAVQGASSELARQVADYRAQLTALEESVRSRDAQIEAISKAATLPEYLEAMRTYRKAFAKDSLCAVLDPIISTEAAYVSLCAAPSVADARNLFWARTVSVLGLADQGKRSRWEAVRKSVLAWENDRRLVDLYECECSEKQVGRDVWGRMLFEGRPSRDFVEGLAMYGGQGYVVRRDDREPSFAFVQLSVDRLKNARLMPHCAAVRDVMSAVRFGRAENADQVLIDAMTQLCASDAIPALLRLRLMDELVQQFRQLVGENASRQWGYLANELRSIDKNLSFICADNPDVLIASRKAEQILDTAYVRSSIGQRYLADMAIKRASLTRGVKWAGRVPLSGGSPVWIDVAEPGEVWVVRASAGAAPSIFLAAETLDSSRKSYVAYLPGEPLFAPTDGRTSRAILGQVKSQYKIADASLLDWYESWPVNLRR